MAIYDSADLLARIKLLTGRNNLSSDASMSDPNWYTLLEEGQAHWTNTFAAQVPYVLMGVPTLLTSSDGGITYPFPSSVYPLAVEVYDSLNATTPLRPCAYWDSTGDYVWEGNQIRMPQSVASSFLSGPYARWVAPPSTLNASNAPTLQPPHARLLCVYRAAAMWAERGGMRDPAPFYRLEHKAWIGDPASGDVGLLGALKNQNPFYGASATIQGSGGLLSGVSTGAGYNKVNP